MGLSSIQSPKKRRPVGRLQVSGDTGIHAKCGTTIVGTLDRRSTRFTTVPMNVCPVPCSWVPMTIRPQPSFMGAFAGLFRPSCPSISSTELRRFHRRPFHRRFQGPVDKGLLVFLQHFLDRIVPILDRLLARLFILNETCLQGDDRVLRQGFGDMQNMHLSPVDLLCHARGHDASALSAFPDRSVANRISVEFW